MWGRKSYPVCQLRSEAPATPPSLTLAATLCRLWRLWCLMALGEDENVHGARSPTSVWRASCQLAWPSATLESALSSRGESGKPALPPLRPSLQTLPTRASTGANSRAYRPAGLVRPSLPRTQAIRDPRQPTSQCSESCEGQAAPSRTPSEKSWLPGKPLAAAAYQPKAFQTRLAWDFGPPRTKREVQVPALHSAPPGLRGCQASAPFGKSRFAGQAFRGRTMTSVALRTKMYYLSCKCLPHATMRIVQPSPEHPPLTTLAKLQISSSQNLLTLHDVAGLLRVHPKRVYSLPIPRVKLSTRRTRWQRADVDAFVVSRRGQAATSAAA